MAASDSSHVSTPSDRYTQEEKDRLVDAILYGPDDDWDAPPWHEDPIARHFGWVNGVPACEATNGDRCTEHGWRTEPLTTEEP